ncbi:PIR protein [Plasmodium yoelii]|uniref:PIR protein n=2 Tax=Plasmodium yoelii TaxID=5861 RepID=A0AAE9WKR4_PLAYO|nr:PIR protein [Plasmodium yoelii]WBY55495.1 PIR protein [Plasmodium yoelii yoelii]CDU16598.1 YIR protein [Plasmodium yoelii]VTZ74023.1 PIR protein [Plasmodium yoelii]|eukprot:XP_022811609.1 PIR protein [Plasmodium yoelii]
MFNEVCKSINTIDEYYAGDLNIAGEKNSRNLLNFLISNNNCSSDDPKIISDFIALLILFNGIGSDENLDSDKLVEYAILWLSYNINQKKGNETTRLDDFHSEHIKRNDCYNENISADSNSGNKIYMEVIDTKIESMNIDIKDISNFYDAFKSLCNMYSEIGAEDYQCNKCLENARELFEKYEKLKNALYIDKGSSYLQLLSSLSNDYNIFKQEYNIKCGNDSSFVACPRSSIIKNILITIAIIFAASSILLGVSYKYSLFGFRKRSQKKKLREMLKK